MRKVVYYVCDQSTGHLHAAINTSAAGAAIAYLADSGAQVINMSFGNRSKGEGWCASRTPQNPDSWCDAIAYAQGRDIALVAASGNNREALQFPANDPRVISVGGIDASWGLWDESPGGTANCPTAPGLLPGRECGSNFSVVQPGPRQELVASAKAVLSTTYPGKDWFPDLACGDSFGPGGGYGLCTGTSMAAPQIAGLVGLLRSINPLLPVSRPVLGFADIAGVRTVLAQHGWDSHDGYGPPDGAVAAARVLGTVRGRTVKNRATPLFHFYGFGAKDYLDTTSPQFALASMVNQSSGYVPQGALAEGYAAFPQDDNAAPFAAPRANAYVLTTEYSPRPEWPPLLPLYLVERSRAFPAGCAAGTPGCNPANRDFTLLTTAAELEFAHADGYALRTIQGYVFAPCEPEPACIPPGTQALYRACKPADDDCAVFLESERNGFLAAGYANAYPSAAGTRIGYAYAAGDSDGDGLPDALEYPIGTRPDAADSDGDGASDAAEFPLAGLAASDPCSGAGGGACPADMIFRHGFQ
jgi:hypothetical protein